MKIEIKLKVSTQPGELVYVLVKNPDCENVLEKELVWSGGDWFVTFELQVEKQLIYTYQVRTNEKCYSEFGGSRILRIPASKNILIKDEFRYPDSQENLLFTSPFNKAFFRRKNQDLSRNSLLGKYSNSTIISFGIRAPRVGTDYTVGILGNMPELGNWLESEVVLLSDEDCPIWKLEIPLDTHYDMIEYKYVIVDQRTNKVVTWEKGANRLLNLGDREEDPLIVSVSDEYFAYPVGMWKTAGFAIPVFSIRSESGCGVGEFSDIPHLVDWAVKTKMKVIQILPVNDTVATHTWVDSYPYAAISVHALHPVYASMRKIGALKDTKQQKLLDIEAEKLNALDQLDYERVMKMKSNFFKLSFDENKLSILNSRELNEFIGNNRSWIIAYAVFSFLRDKFKTADFSQWGKFKSMSESELHDFASPDQPHYDDIAVHYYIQFHLDKQLKEATEYARENGVVLKGDIPIGIFRNSVDAWRWPQLFNMKTQTGAPPDDFSVVGQNWGFPTYNWEAMRQDDYSWWVSRMKKMADYFDVFRIDHILGFFRIWEIPEDSIDGLLGYFNPALPFSVDELKDYGLHWDEDRFCKPYISDDLLTELFGDMAEFVKEGFLEKLYGGSYILKPEVSSQKGIRDKLDLLIQKSPEKQSEYEAIRLVLYSLPTQVLFLKSTRESGKFNPRINLHQTASFNALDFRVQEILFRLHNDYFYHRHNQFWRDSAMDKLPMLKDATDMLICGEDLGMVPACVPGVMKELQVLSLAIQRMPNDDREFWKPQDIPYMYVTSTGSHDVSNLREWWLEDPQISQRFYNDVLGFEGAAPDQCKPWVAYETIRQHLSSSAMLSIFPIQDILAMSEDLRREDPLEERINIPAIVPHYWRYRMHLSIEQLLGEERFNQNLAKLVDANGRYADY